MELLNKFHWAYVVESNGLFVLCSVNINKHEISLNFLSWYFNWEYLHMNMKSICSFLSLPRASPWCASWEHSRTCIFYGNLPASKSMDVFPSSSLQLPLCFPSPNCFALLVVHWSPQLLLEQRLVPIQTVVSNKTKVKRKCYEKNIMIIYLLICNWKCWLFDRMSFQ